MGLLQILKGEQPGIIKAILNYENRGQFGEYLIEYALSHDNLPGYLKTMCNLYIPHKGKTAEIDVLMLHEKGLFVFESKNYSGWIFGDAEAQKWTQCLQNKQKHQFYNPILQNRTHIQALATYLELPETVLMSYIIFSERCELKKVPADTYAYTILRRHHLLRNLRRSLNDRPVLYTHQEIDALWDKLQATIQVTAQEKSEHIQGILDRTEGSVCPFCGAQLVLRKGKYGNFYGCSTYPKCRFTRKL